MSSVSDAFDAYSRAILNMQSGGSMFKPLPLKDGSTWGKGVDASQFADFTYEKINHYRPQSANPFGKSVEETKRDMVARAWRDSIMIKLGLL